MILLSYILIGEDVMRKTQKILSFILAILMVMSIIPITASAETEHGTCGDNLTWEFNYYTGALTISGTGVMYDYNWNNRPWEGYKNNVNKIVINDGVTTIGDYAFSGLYNLTDVTISDSVTIIDDCAFSECSELTSITISSGVTAIGKNAFSWCYNLTSITVDSDNLYYSNDEHGVLFNKDKTTLVQYTTGKTETSYIIPDSVTTIDYYAFGYSDSLTSIAIPASVTTIGDDAFYCCTNLTSITVDADNPNYSSDDYGVLFNKDKTMLIQHPVANARTNYTIPDSVTAIKRYAFIFCEGLTSVTIPDSVVIIGEYAFTWCYGLTDVKIPDSVTTIGDGAFGYCSNLTDMIIPDSVTTIGDYAFQNCTKLTNIKISNSIKKIGYHTFFLCESLTNITIPDNVTIIDENAFSACFSLTSIIIPDNVTTIGACAFDSCYNLKDVYYKGTEKQWKSISIDNCNEPLLNATIHYNYHMHKYNEVITDPTCTEQGYTTYTCECGDTYIDNYVDLTGHTDNDGDGYCDVDNELLDPSVECECNCHKSGIAKFLFKFILFFQKIFGLNKECACGVVHY